VTDAEREGEALEIAFEAFAASLAHPPAAEDMWRLLSERERGALIDVARAARRVVEARLENQIAALEEHLSALLTPANENAVGLPTFLLPGPDGRTRRRPLRPGCVGRLDRGMTDPEQLDRIEHKLDVLLAHLGIGPGGRRAPAGGGGGGQQGPEPPASDADLNGPRGNPEVRFDPKRWEGQSYKGRTFSECDPDYLDMLAETFEYFARKEDGEGAVDKNGGPKSRWTRLDAARARGWAQRLRGGSAARQAGPRGGDRAPRPQAAQRRPAPPPPADFEPPQGDPFGGGGAFGEDDDIPF
jgi:hypothetical protein